MSKSDYVDVLLTQGCGGTTRTFVVPISTASIGDVVLHDSCMFTVIGNAWVAPDTDVYIVLEGSTTLYVPDKIMRVKWEKPEVQQNAEN